MYFSDGVRLEGLLHLPDGAAANRPQRDLIGRSELVNPWSVDSLNPPTQANVQDDMYGNHERFGVDVSLQSAEAYYAFRAELVAAWISPRPLLVVHGRRTALLPIEEARSLSERASRKS